MSHKTNTKLPALLYLYIFRKSVAYASCDIHQKEDFWQQQSHVKSCYILSFFKGPGWLVGTATRGACEAHLSSSKLNSVQCITIHLASHQIPNLGSENSLSWRFPGCFLGPTALIAWTPEKAPHLSHQKPSSPRECCLAFVHIWTNPSPFAWAKGNTNYLWINLCHLLPSSLVCQTSKEVARKASRLLLGHGQWDTGVWNPQYPSRTYQLHVQCTNCPTHTTAGQTYYPRNISE